MITYHIQSLWETDLDNIPEQISEPIFSTLSACLVKEVYMKMYYKSPLIFGEDRIDLNSAFGDLHQLLCKKHSQYQCIDFYIECKIT